MVDPCFMQAYASEDLQLQGQLSWNPQPPQGMVSWNTQQPVQLCAWLNAGTPQAMVQGTREAILKYVRSINKGSRGQSKAQGQQKTFNPNARNTMHAELPGRMIKSDSTPLYCFNCQSVYHLAGDCPKNPNRRPPPPKYLNITFRGNVSSRQNRVNVVQSGPDTSVSADLAENPGPGEVQAVGCDETQLIPTKEDGIFQEANQLYIHFGNCESSHQKRG